MAERFTIVGLGESLFDVYPDRQVLGGAPANVAVHAHQLARVRQGRGVVVSRVGQDELGRQIHEELARRGMTSAYLQTDPDKATGSVYVDAADPAQPRFEIARDMAWDWLQYDPDVDSLARQCEAVCFGSLIQREGQARNSVYRFLEAARRAVRLFDVNLRQDFFDRRSLVRSLEFATAVKLNTSELDTLASLLGLDGEPVPADDAQRVELRARALLKRYDLRFAVVTGGAGGTMILTPTSRHKAPAPRYEPAPGADSVGAGDACAAAVLVGTVLRFPFDRIVSIANHAGAFVASQSGATPDLPQSILDMLGNY